MSEQPKVSDEIAALPVALAPIGTCYCLTHHGLREEDESRGCSWAYDEEEEACRFVDLFPGTEVVDTYLDPAFEDEEDES